MLDQDQLQNMGLDVLLVNHPLVQHKLTLMRDKNQSSTQFRSLLREISW